ncbi:MAG: pyridoxal phosphate-dependent aminotransferase [Thermotogaceae bacterium]|nr:pyridoxal phosphate-dependent aminotransferase [Mesotoga sp.]MDI9374431.1 pyridoxal phosphate-dependent aminotransferase [Thermotogota bacterium]NLX34962.1 pyridoxal phosphate-dependent aminotransferase [Thermotogaceae bacterium]HPI18544.1 pyridoxal phosphate-dependent aminotransferase [Mesotoga sp.]HPX23559.1 pyridoxal phosphate-dependent aminotransferase [Mesotoga sp.]
MDQLEAKFSRLGVDNAPGQEVTQAEEELQLVGEKIPGKPVDFSHGDVDAFEPTPESLDAFIRGVYSGGEQAYTEYKGRTDIREALAEKLSAFTDTQISADTQLIITPGTQGALFLVMGSLVGRGDKVAIVEPDYFANRKLTQFFDGEMIPVELNYLESDKRAGLDLNRLEDAFKDGVKVFLFSNPNNPTGVVYSPDEVRSIAFLAQKYGVSLIVDQLNSRQIFDGRAYTHLCAQEIRPETLITIIGPSKTESLSGYRLGVAFGSKDIIKRMEKLQAIVSLRAGGYSQAVLKSWFNEPEGWIEERTKAHERIRDDLLALLRGVEGVKVRKAEAGSYLFIKTPELTVTMGKFVKILRILASVTVTPGTEFGPKFTDSFRINFSQDHHFAVEAVERTIQIIERYRK